MSLIRVKVQLNENKPPSNSRNVPAPLKFVYLLDLSSTKTIDDLRRSLEQYIIRQFTKSNVQIVQLMTGDGYSLPEDALCEHILKDDEQIFCVNMETFFEENFWTLILENFWCEIKQHDASDDDEKHIQVGLNKAGKLFIRTRNAWNAKGLYLFNVFQLMKIADEKSKSKKKSNLRLIQSH